MWVGDVSVNLGGANVGMAEESLNGANVGAVHKEIGRERMTKSVRRDVLGDAGCMCVFFDHAFDATRSETTIVARSIDGLKVFAVV